MNFFLEILMTVSLGIILYLMARVLPRINDAEIHATPIIKDQWFVRYLEIVDEWIAYYSEKMLRRIKVWISKLDNNITKKLSRFKKENPKDIKPSLVENKESED